MLRKKNWDNFEFEKKKVENERGKVDRKKYDEVLSREKRELTLVGPKTIKIIISEKCPCGVP